jgi:Protein of unknown function (DUF3768)
MTLSDTRKIAELNDEARRTLSGCRVVLTRGVVAMGELDTVLAAVTAYNDFSERNDPYGEHDFGVFEVAGQTLFWKIDYYDVDLTTASPDPTDIAVTARVLTVMLGEEY